jgi:formylglycine-generating enzyme required for sulfatase activity
MRALFLLISLSVAAGAALPAFAQERSGQPLTLQEERALKPKDAFRECEVCPEMVVVPPGEFLMGSPEEEKDREAWEGPLHKVKIGRAFAAGRFEVRRDEFEAFVEETGRATGPDCTAFADLLNGKPQSREGLSYRNPGFPQGDSHPVLCISWRDAKDYVAWLSQKTGKAYRLLSEAEWEYAARAGAVTPYHFGRDASALCSYANGADQTFEGKRPPDVGEGWADLACRDGYVYTAPVGSFAANAFGLHDMHGNVEEWVEDCAFMLEKGVGYANPPADGSPWISGNCPNRVTRGGSWASPAASLRAAARSEAPADKPQDFVGLRVARTLSR